MRRRLKAMASARGGDERTTLRERVDALTSENERLRRENERLKAELATHHSQRARQQGDIDLDAFALCGVKHKNNNHHNHAAEDDEGMRECGCQAALAHAQAAQRAVTFFALQDTLLSQALDGARPHLQALNDSLPHGWHDAVRAPFLAPLKAQIRDLENGVAKARRGEEITKRRFVELRQHTVRPVTTQMRGTMAGFVRAFDGLDVGAITAAVERLRRDHKLLGVSDMAALQCAGPSGADPRSLGFLQRMYAVAKAVQGPLKQLLEGAGERVGAMGTGGGGTVEVQMGGLKGLDRVFEKTMEEYDGDFSRLGDIVRGSLVCDGAKEAAGVLEHVSLAAREKGDSLPSLRVVRVKNRLDPGFDAEAESGGYRDVLVNVAVGVERAAVFGDHEPEGDGDDLVFLVCEIQVHLRSFHDIKGAGGAHRLYKQARSLHLLDKELGQAYVHGGKGSFDEAMEKVERGECRAFRADFFELDERMATRLRDALLDRDVCGVEVLSLHSASLAKEATRVFDGHHIEGLREVVLNDNQGIDGAFVARFVSKRLRVLKFRGCKVGAEGTRAIVAQLQQTRPTGLLELDARDNNIGSEGATAAAPSLKELTSLTTLALGGNNLEDKGIVAIAPSLKTLTNLTALALGGNSIGPEGAAALVPSLVALASTLTILSLGGNNTMGGEGVAAIAPAIKALTNLTTLFLDGTNMGSEGAAALAPSLEGLTRLATLYLNGNNMGSEGVAAIAPSLKALSSLTMLYLDGNGMGSRGAAAIAPSLKELTKLALLRVGDNRLTNADERLLKASAPPSCSTDL